MSDISPTSTTLRLKPAINESNPPQSRGQPDALPAAVVTSPIPVTDSVTISATAQAAAGGQIGGTALTEEEAQNTAVNLRQQISLQGLSASARQNTAVLNLIRSRS
jgi:hypothetical protein